MMARENKCGLKKMVGNLMKSLYTKVIRKAKVRVWKSSKAINFRLPAKQGLHPVRQE